MSCNDWCFETVLSIPNYSSHYFYIKTRYNSGLNFDYNPPPSYGKDLIELFNNNKLDIYAIYGLEEWTDNDLGSGAFCQNLRDYLYKNEKLVLAVVIGSLSEDNPANWYEDT